MFLLLDIKVSDDTDEGMKYIYELERAGYPNTNQSDSEFTLDVWGETKDEQKCPTDSWCQCGEFVKHKKDHKY